MKKDRFYLVLCLLLALCVLLTGCGRKKSKASKDPKKPPASTIQFLLPDSYVDPNDGFYYSLTPGQNVEFYLLADDDEEKIVEVIETFSGKTGDGTLKFTLPESLKGVKCYIYAVVGAYDLKGKTISEAKKAAEKGEILFGTILNDTGEQALPVTLNNNVTIGNFTFIGKGEGQPEKSIFFIMPDTYWVGEATQEIPANLEIKIYSVSHFDEDGKAHTDYTFTGTTGGQRIRRTLPDFLDGATRTFMAVIYLKESSFELDGKTEQDLLQAMEKGEILFGQTQSDEDYVLFDGVQIEDFEFYGPIPNGDILFEMPNKSASGKDIPSRKTVKFYALTSTDQPLEVEHVFKGTTGSNIIKCELPGLMIDEEYYFFAVIILKGDFDLEGKSIKDLIDPVNEGQIMYGVAKEDGGEGETKLFLLEDGITIDGFVFMDQIPEQPGH